MTEHILREPKTLGFQELSKGIPSSNYLKGIYSHLKGAFLWVHDEGLVQVKDCNDPVPSRV